MAGEWLTATTNTNMFTYEIAPVFILMEQVVMQKMREIIGWNTGDSILAPGGSISNLYAFLAARHRMFPNYKEHGAKCLPGELVMFTSDQSHYSVKSCAAVSGLGTDNCIIIPSDEGGHMIASELEKAIVERKGQGQIPFFVSATAGTTVLGSFDPIQDIADICEKHGLWFHVDVSLMQCTLISVCLPLLLRLQGSGTLRAINNISLFVRLLGVVDCCFQRSIVIHVWLELNGKYRHLCNSSQNRPST